jgi:hypothetical protein
MRGCGALLPLAWWAYALAVAPSCEYLNLLIEWLPAGGLVLQISGCSGRVEGREARVVARPLIRTTGAARPLAMACREKQIVWEA